MNILIMMVLVVGVGALVAFGVAAFKMQKLLFGEPKEKLKHAGMNLENIAMNLAPNYLKRSRKLKNPEIDRIARLMLIEFYVFVSIFFVLLTYMIVIAF